MKEFRVMYTNHGYSVPALQPWFPTRELATKALKKLKKRPSWQTEKLFLAERVGHNKIQMPCQRYRGKPVYSQSYYFCEALEPGDYVSEDVIDNMVNALPPACMRHDCVQSGEPYSCRIDASGKTRNTFWTFKCIAEHIWEFCGDCFLGENEQRGEIPVYMQ